ncbi:MotA/TolQ/ExbB proton channel family protein [bacterium]|nr:MotA/TolQ/ExbB proton channel family protein [bacterium]
MNTPYAAPNSNPQLVASASDIPASRVIAMTGSILLAGPIFGVIGTVIGMIGAFNTLAEGDGSADPNELASNISMALMTTLYGAAFGLVGVAFVCTALYRRSNREKWFYRTVVTLSVLWCVLLFPIGLLVGIYLIRIFSARKAEFYPSP